MLGQSFALVVVPATAATVGVLSAGSALAASNSDEGPVGVSADRPGNGGIHESTEEELNDAFDPVDSGVLLAP